MKFTKIPTTTMQEIQLNAGVLLAQFTPVNPVISSDDIIGATTGGVNFSATPSFTDFGEDIDNCPKNTMELKKLDDYDVKMTGNFVTVTAGNVKRLIGTADAGVLDVTKVTPRRDVLQTDFEDLWFVGDYSDYNGENKGGFIAIHLLNSLSTGGFKLQSSDKNKGQFAFEFTGHYSMSAQDVVPFEVYVKAGEPEAGGYSMEILSQAGTTSGKTKITTGETAGSGESYMYQTGYGIYAPAKGTKIAGSAWTTWNGSAEITAETGMDIVVVIKDSENLAVHAGKGLVVAAE